MRDGHVRIPGCAQEVPRRVRKHLRGNRKQAIGQLHPPHVPVQFNTIKQHFGRSAPHFHPSSLAKNIQLG